MKTLLTLTLLATCATASFGQFGVNYHQSNLPFAGINYEIADRFRPELRIGTDNFLEDLSVEIVGTYDVVNKEDYEFYLGAGFRGNNFQGVVIPLGLNFYPLTTKNFGFHIELTPILADDDPILRGSWGIRYRFRKSE